MASAFWTIRGTALPDRPDRVPTGVIASLGITQIIGYGTLYYSFSILAPDMARDIGWSTEGVFGLFSASLLIGGLFAPFAGQGMDRFGASRLMTIGSVIASLTLVACSLSTSAATLAASVIALEIAASLVLYQAAFAALVEITPQSAARSITYLTLIAGFASTVFWPFTTALHAEYSWRSIYLFFAALNLGICVPLHYLIARYAAPAPRKGTTARQVVAGVLAPAERRSGLILCAIAFALLGFALSAMLVHMVPLLTTLGLGSGAIVVAAVFGPSQVLARLVNMLFGRNLSPVMLAVLSAVSISAAIAALLLSGSWLPGAIAFAVLLGLGSGINSIAQGSLPLWLFGSEGYGTLTGRIAAVRLLASATAPFIFATLMDRAGSTVALGMAATLGAAAMLGFLAIRPASTR
jgi:predicted MFS family arabinose efflux permease